MASSGDLVRKEYKDFRGVDFNDGEIVASRSPFSLNMWKNYKENARCVETRPDIELKETYDNVIYGMFFYTKNDTLHKIVHCGTKLYDNSEQIFVGMNIAKSQYFVFNEILYIKDGINYLKYDGTEVKSVEGTVPITSTGKSPSGAGTTYQDVNLLTGIRKNSFVADGTSTIYQLDTGNLDTNYTVTAVVNDITIVEGMGLTVDRTAGKVTFSTAPAEPTTTGQDNVVITFSKTVQGYRDRVLKCTLLTEFDNRIFFSGNQNYPNVVFHSSLEDPEYVSDLDYYNEGLDVSPVKSMVAGNNALWVFKEPSQANTTIYYHNPVIDNTYGKIYPSTHSSISTGCVATGINFNDDICFFSDRGMEAISSDVTTEQVLSHRSSMVDNKLLSETNYKNMLLEEWEGYLLVIIDKHIYLADSRQKYQDISIEYEWYYWELPYEVTCTRVKDEVLYLGMNNQIYTLTKTDSNISSVWTLPKEDFNAPQFLKTTNKRGGTAVCDGKITVKVKKDNNDYITIDTYEESKGYVVYRIKQKKFKDLQIEFSSNKPMKLYSCTIEAFVGGYVKR